MANQVWVKRVEAWRKSGLSSFEFAEGKQFTAGGLRHMASRLRAAAKPPQIRFARVVRPRPPTVVSDAGAAVVLVIGAVRIEVGPGASREALATVLASLAQRSQE